MNILGALVANQRNERRSVNDIVDFLGAQRMKNLGNKFFSKPEYSTPAGLKQFAEENRLSMPELEKFMSLVNAFKKEQGEWKRGYKGQLYHSESGKTSGEIEPEPTWGDPQMGTGKIFPAGTPYQRKSTGEVKVLKTGGESLSERKYVGEQELQALHNALYEARLMEVNDERKLIFPENYTDEEFNEAKRISADYGFEPVSRYDPGVRKWKGIIDGLAPDKPGIQVVRFRKIGGRRTGLPTGGSNWRDLL